MGSTAVRSGSILLLSKPNASSSCITRCFHPRISTPTLSFLLPPKPRNQHSSLSILTGRSPSSSSSLLFQSRSRRSFCASSDDFPPPAGDATAALVDSPPPPSSSSESDLIKAAADALDIRVGRVLRAWRHPEADSLYVEEVDVGEPEPRTICSGLVSYIPIEELRDAQVVVLANLKPRNMRGIKSNGMLMAASDASHENVELLLPPEGSTPGERIWFGSEIEKGNQLDAATPNQVQKKKIWESVQPHLKTTESCVVVLGVDPMRTSAGVVVCRTLKNANVS